MLFSTDPWPPPPRISLIAFSAALIALYFPDVGVVV
jgi:hypothetical protein